MSVLTILTLLIICTTAIGQTVPHKKNPWHRVDTLFTKNDIRQKPLTFYPGAYIDTEARYADSTGIVVIIQNSLPKGGRYTDPAGKNFQYRIFWTRVINESEAPLELTIGFPSGSILPSAESSLKLFLPADTMTLSKESLHDYGVTGLKSFLDSGLNESTQLQRTINPKEACLFYIGALIDEGGYGGPPRAELILREQDLFYRIRGISSELGWIPCGQIVSKK